MLLSIVLILITAVLFFALGYVVCLRRLHKIMASLTFEQLASLADRVTVERNRT